MRSGTRKATSPPAEFRRFCNSTVPLARLPRRVFTTDQVLEAALEVAHFGPRPLVEASLAWKLVADDGKAVASGRRFAPKIPDRTTASRSGP